MAGGAQPLRGALAAGGVALALVLALTLGSLWPLTRAAGGAGLGPADLAALRFTLIQALLSAAFSVLGAVPLARALARRRFPLRGPMLALMGAPFLLPAIVAVLGITAIWGRSGLVSQASVALGGPRLDIYGLEGVVLGHVFFNLGLVTRLILQGWAAVPGEHWRLVSQLGMKSGAVFRVIEWPMLREVLPGAFLIVFLLAAASFAVALALGGGPGASTMEVAIYEALRFDFDPGRAALLALMQLGLCAAASLAVLALGRAAGFGPGLGLVPLRPEAGGRSLRLLDGAVIGGAALFLFLPLAALVARGLP
ncbi:MAG TPA: thiamine/thiamine pyrophosphate ABC transporter permease ThiP, partial [Paracoccaceae bacterium]|nr:thiamine/thiamine pyrophosphate ABC transporter permease ThiP [Paracoccaceae bacterium]